MIENINKIKNCKHPYSGEINRISALIEKIFNILLIAINTIGFITAIIASTGLAEWIDEQNYDEVDIPVDFLGYLIDIESDTFGGSPFFAAYKKPENQNGLPAWCTRLDSNQRPLESEQTVAPFLWGILVSYKCLKTLINQWFPAVLPVFLYLPVIPRIC